MNNCLLCESLLDEKLTFCDLLTLKKPKAKACDACFEKFQRISVQHCPKCYRDGIDEICIDCDVWTKKGKEVCHKSCFVYNEAMKNFFSQYKFQGDYVLSSVFTEVLHQELKNYSDYTLVPIPVSVETYQARGFNQVTAFLEGTKLQFKEILETEFKHEPYREQLWEDYYGRHVKELLLEARHYSADIVKEFDSLDELRQFDERYLVNADSAIIDNICKTLKCVASDIVNIKPLKDGLTNTSFSFDCLGKRYVYRHPGRGTENYIDRASEAASMEIAAKLKIDRTFVAMNKDEGWKISEFIPNAKQLDYDNWDDVAQAMDLLRRLHQSGEKTGHSFDQFEGIDDFREKLKARNRFEFDGLEELDKTVSLLKNYLQNDPKQVVLCHGDSYSPNFLLNEAGEMSLIDWEYSGMGEPAGDLGTFIACSNYTVEDAEKVLELYLQGVPDKKTKRHYLAYVAVTSYYWFLWALFQESVGKPVGEFLYIWYRYTKQYGQLALDLYLEEN